MQKGSLDEEVQKLIESNSLLRDRSFLAKYPQIIGIASFLNSVAKTMEGVGRKYPLFVDLGIENIEGYLELLNSKDQKAIISYKKMQDNLGL